MTQKFKHEFKMEDVPSWSEVKSFWDDLVGAKFLGDISYRDFMILSLLVWYGRRIGEVMALTVDDFDLRRGDNGVIRFLQLKTRKQRHKVTLPVIPQLKKFINEYINKELNPFGHKKLFDISTRQARNVVYTYTEKYLGRRLRPHAFRHAIGDYLTRVRGIAYAQYWLGHSSIAITEIYTHYNYKTIEEELPEEFK